MQCRPVDVFDDQEFEDFHRITVAAESAGRPHATPPSLRDAQVTFRRPNPSERMEAYGAFSGAEMVGAATGFVPLRDNTWMAWVKVHVAPEHRQRGVGAALVEFAVDRARGAGRTVVLTEIQYPFADRDDHPYRRFAERHQFALALSNVRRRLQLPLVAGVLETLAAQAKPFHAGYRIETFVDGLPEELLPSYCHVHNQLSVDAPSGDVGFEEEALTPSAARDRYAALAEAGARHYATVAVDGGGSVVAFTNLTLPDGQTTADQGGTLVLREHRGHRLGMAVKVRNLQAMTGENPDRTAVDTCNAEVNAHMVAINEALGFRPLEIEDLFQRKLSG